MMLMMMLLLMLLLSRKRRRREEKRKDGECTQKPEPQSNDMGKKDRIPSKTTFQKPKLLSTKTRGLLLPLEVFFQASFSPACLSLQVCFLSLSRP